MADFLRIPADPQYAAGKNTADIALALDAMEAMFDCRADTFCLVTSDSDFAYLCRKLRERGATVHIVGEAKTPDALRNASDQFFEWLPPELITEPADSAKPKTTAAPAKPPAKRRPKAVIKAVELLAGDTPDGWVADRTRGEPPVTIEASDDDPQVFQVESASARLEVLAALYLFLYSGSAIVAPKGSLDSVQQLALQARYSTELRRAADSLWHQASDSNPYPNLTANRR